MVTTLRPIEPVACTDACIPEGPILRAGTMAASHRQVEVVACTDTCTFEGYTYCAYGQRLLDALNEGFEAANLPVSKDFLPLSGVEVFTTDGVRQHLASTYIRKGSILFVAEKSESRWWSKNNMWPSREKVPVGVRVNFSSQTLGGKIHKDTWAQLGDVLEGNDRFLPLTDIEISPTIVTGESKFSFAAINKERIVSVFEDSTDPSGPVDLKDRTTTDLPGEANDRKQGMSRNASRHELISYAEIGRRLGISRERVRQIADRNAARNRKQLPVATANPASDIPPDAAETMLAAKDVASLLNLHVNTVRRWNNEGILKAYRMGPRGDRRFPREDVLRLVSEGL
jgi:excisionase family DNA binding protein